MFDSLIDLIVQSLRMFMPWSVVPQYADGVILRLGKFNRRARKGFQWMWPFHIEECLQIGTVTDTMKLLAQSLTTKDGKSVVISVIVTFTIFDVEKFLLEVEGTDQVIEDSTTGVVSKFITSYTWDELCALDLAAELTKRVRRQAKRFGVHVEKISLRDLALSRSIRLIGSGVSA